MNKIMQFGKGIFFLLYLLSAFLITYKSEYITETYNIPIYFVLTVAFLMVVRIGYSYLQTLSQISKLDYEFTSIVNHVFRTPLTRILWLIKELEREDMTQQEKLQYLQNTQNATNIVLDIVDHFAGIKNLNDTSSYFFEATSVRDIVEKSITKHKEEINKKSINFQIPTFKDIPLLTLDIKKISFVIDSLIENAIFYTPKEGQVSIECHKTPNKIVLSITDSGIGLSTRDKVRTFSRFYRNKRAVLMNPNGTGIKLYLANKIIKRHKGKLYAKSSGQNKGSAFSIELPYTT